MLKFLRTVRIFFSENISVHSLELELRKQRETSLFFFFFFCIYNEELFVESFIYNEESFEGC